MKIVQLNPDFVYERIQCFIVIDYSIQNQDNWSLSNFLLELPGKWDYSFAALKNDVILGFIVCSKVNASCLHIHRLAVANGHQNKGIGTSLLNLVLEKAKYQFNSVTLKVSLDNIHAQKFYERNFFILDYLEGVNMVYRRII